MTLNDALTLERREAALGKSASNAWYDTGVEYLLKAQNAEGAWTSLKDSGSTHVVIHRNAFANVADADTVENWLKAHGATEIERFADGDLLFKL